MDSCAFEIDVTIEVVPNAKTTQAEELVRAIGSTLYVGKTPDGIRLTGKCSATVFENQVHGPCALEILREKKGFSLAVPHVRKKNFNYKVQHCTFFH